MKPAPPQSKNHHENDIDENNKDPHEHESNKRARLESPPKISPTHENEDESAKVQLECTPMIQQSPESILLPTSTSNPSKDNDEQNNTQQMPMVQSLPTSTTNTITPINETFQKNSTLPTSEKNQNSHEDNNEDEIEVLKCNATNANIALPHLRHNCGQHPYSPQNAISFCQKCYCSVCNKPVQECTNWNSHCHQQTKNPKVDKKNTKVSYDEVEVIEMEHDPNLDSMQFRDQINSLLQVYENRSSPMNKRYERPEKHLRITELLDKKLSLAIQNSEGRHSTTDRDDTENTKMEGDISRLNLLQRQFVMEGIQIGWPYPEIMRPQRLMALHLIRALKRSLHVVLESPTGTGKSAAILCTVLAWQRYHAKQIMAQQKQRSSAYGVSDLDNESKEESLDPKVPKIIYCSRTHSQVAQMVASLKKTPYRPRMAVLGSRERLCIHRDMKSRGPDNNNNEKISRLPLNQECQFRVRNTERMRKGMSNNYNDDNPPCSCPSDGKGSTNGRINNNDANDRKVGEEALVDENGNVSHSTTENTQTSNGWVHKDSTTKLTCPHYRQLTTTRTVELARSRFMTDKSIINCCQVGGEKTKLGVHDIEDLVSFGVNPYIERGVAIYRKDGKGSFGMTLEKKGSDPTSIHKIAKYGAADMTGGTVQEQDTFLKINGKNSRKWSMQETTDEIKRTADDPLELDLLRSGAPYDDNSDDNHFSDHSACPYFLSRALSKHAELIFAPYNYVLDPSIRNALDIELEGNIVILDEAHNVEDNLRSSGSIKIGEFELCEILCMLSEYATKRKTSNNTVKVGTKEKEVDISVIAHEILLIVESLIEHLRDSRMKFESGNGKSSAKQVIEEYQRFRTPDDKEFEMTYHGPTGYGIGGKSIGCMRFLQNLNFSKEKLSQVNEFCDALDSYVGGNTNADDHQSFIEQRKGSTMVSRVHELISKLLVASKKSEHFFIQSVIKANGSLAFASGEDNGPNRPRYRKKPTSIPYVQPRTSEHPNVAPHTCPHRGCKSTFHADFCDGKTPKWESVFILELLTPGILMEDITSKCRTVALASGSLAPISSLCAELNLFPSKTKTAGNSPAKTSINGRLQVQPKPLEADHVIDPDKQLRAISIGCFPDGSPLTVSYTHYKHASFFPKLGHAIASIIEAVPHGGVLIFVPSYSFLKKCQKSWNPVNSNRWASSHHDETYHDSSIWERFVGSKNTVIIEPTGSQDQFEEAKENYNNAIKNDGTCILIAVFRGKMSEGISFNDDYARAVICVGIPLPAAFDKAIDAKKKYNDEQRKLCGRTDLLPGSDWYLQQAYRAIAQALGRCIRHSADYGAVFLMDSRHCYDGAPYNGICQQHKNLPQWMRQQVRNLSNSQINGYLSRSKEDTIFGGYGGLARELKIFFQRASVFSKEKTEKTKIDFENASKRVNKSLQHEFNSSTGKWSLNVKKESKPLSNKVPVARSVQKDFVDLT